jgi:hypothetical protein
MDILTPDFDRISVIEPEDDSVLIIHSNAPVTGPVILEFLKPASRTFQVIKTDGGIEHVQFANHNRPNSPVDLPCGFRISAVINVLSRSVGEGRYHRLSIHVYRVHVNHAVAQSH